ncbi:hypothetical protein [Lapidilactobacillus bayanensis]|nr:hypothetical protein [Lapidilactobacillus bayanensis]
MSKNKAEIAKQLELNEGSPINLLSNANILNGSIRENKKTTSSCQMLF